MSARRASRRLTGGFWGAEVRIRQAVGSSARKPSLRFEWFNDGWAVRGHRVLLTACVSEGRVVPDAATRRARSRHSAARRCEHRRRALGLSHRWTRGCSVDVRKRAMSEIGAKRAPVWRCAVRSRAAQVYANGLAWTRRCLAQDQSPGTRLKGDGWLI